MKAPDRPVAGRRSQVPARGLVAPVELGALLAIEPDLVEFTLLRRTAPIERDRGMLARLLFLEAGVVLGLEERVVVERIGGDETIQRHRHLERGVLALERQMILDDGRAQGLPAGLHSTSHGSTPPPGRRQYITALQRIRQVTGPIPDPETSGSSAFALRTVSDPTTAVRSPRRSRSGSCRRASHGTGPRPRRPP